MQIVSIINLFPRCLGWNKIIFLIVTKRVANVSEIVWRHVFRRRRDTTGADADARSDLTLNTRRYRRKLVVSRQLWTSVIPVGMAFDLRAGSPSPLWIVSASFAPRFRSSSSLSAPRAASHLSFADLMPPIVGPRWCLAYLSHLLPAPRTPPSIVAVSWSTPVYSSSTDPWCNNYAHELLSPRSLASKEHLLLPFAHAYSTKRMKAISLRFLYMLITAPSHAEVIFDKMYANRIYIIWLDGACEGFFKRRESRRFTGL